MSCALLVRIAYNLTVARDYYPLHDSGGYRDIAYHLLDDHCYCWLPPHIVSVSHAPLWPFIIAGISLVVGRANIFDRLFMCFADAGTCVLIYLFARDLFNKRLGLIVTLRRYWRKLFFAYLIVLGTLAEILVFYGNARFRSPIEPILILLTVGTIWWLTHTEPGTLPWMLGQRPAIAHDQAITRRDREKEAVNEMAESWTYPFQQGCVTPH